MIDRLRARADAVRDRVPISSVIGRAVTLRKSGQEWDGLCPFHSDRRIGSFKVNDKKQLFKCFACNTHGDHFAFLAQHKGLSFVEALELLERENGLDGVNWNDPAKIREADAARQKREAEAQVQDDKRRKRGGALWHGGIPIDRTPAAAYLQSRGIWVGANDDGEIGLDSWPGSFRYRPDVWCGHSRDNGGPPKLPALIAGVWHLDGTLLGCHRHFLDIRGWDHASKSGRVTKAPLGKEAKASLGPSRGGYIPVQKGRHRCALKDVPDGTPIFMSEGIEDALTVALGNPHERVIAGVSLSKMGAVELPPQMGDLVWIMQRDPDGSPAADALERAIAAHQAKGRRVRQMWPPPGYKDWNDFLMGKRMDAQGAHNGTQN